MSGACITCGARENAEQCPACVGEGRAIDDSPMTSAERAVIARLKLTPEVRAALVAAGEDPEAVAGYLASDLPGMRRKGEDRINAAEARIRREQRIAASRRAELPVNVSGLAFFVVTVIDRFELRAVEAESIPASIRLYAGRGRFALCSSEAVVIAEEEVERHLHTARSVAVTIQEITFAAGDETIPPRWVARCTELYELDALRALDALTSLLATWQDEGEREAA